MFEQMDGTWKCLFCRTDEKCDWIRTILFRFPGELSYLKTKILKNLLEAGETEDSISEIRNPKFSEVKQAKLEQ